MVFSLTVCFGLYRHGKDWSQLQWFTCRILPSLKSENPSLTVLMVPYSEFAESFRLAYLFCCGILRDCREGSFFLPLGRGEENVYRMSNNNMVGDSCYNI